MQIIEVSTPEHERDFLLLPISIYANDANWIRPLDKDIEEVFSKTKNKFFRHGECTRWLAYDEKNNCIGRVAAFINQKLANKTYTPTGGMGFFECINDYVVAEKLFNTCKDWLMQRGMKAMDGPINFGERDSWFGLLVEGFAPPTYKMNYNPKYYQDFFERFGFRDYFQQWCFAMTTNTSLQEKFFKRHKEIADTGNYFARPFSKSNLEKFAEDFRIIYNKAWAKNSNTGALEQKQVLAFFKKMKPVIDPYIVWFVYYKDEPVAFWLNLPDLNSLFKHYNGKFAWMEKLRFMLALKFGNIDKFVGIAFGIVPEHQGKGVDSFMIVEAAKTILRKTKYKHFEMQWIGDFNPKMINIAEALGTYRSRVLITYRCLFDNSVPFARHPLQNL